MFNLVDGGFLIFMAALAVTAGLVFLIKIGLTKLLHPVRKAKVQVAGVERQDLSVNADARKLTSMPTSGKDVTPVMSNGGMTSANLAHAMAEQSMFMKLVEEIGEVAEVLNKRAGRKASDENDLQEQLGVELADMIHYIVAIAAINDIDLTTLIVEKDRKASIKYHHTVNLETFLRERNQ